MGLAIFYKTWYIIYMQKHTIFFLGLFIGASLVSVNIPKNAVVNAAGKENIPEIPFYSQFSDIHSPKWQKLGCGIASLAMLIDFYRPGTVSVDNLLKEGIDAGAFINGAGWSHKGLAFLAEKYDLKGTSYDLSNLDMNKAFNQLEKILKEGPVMASVRYKFEPKNSIPHLVVINGIDNGMVYYNDPASKSGGKNISVQNFMKAWKKRFIAVRP